MDEVNVEVNETLFNVVTYSMIFSGIIIAFLYAPVIAANLFLFIGIILVLIKLIQFFIQ